MRTVCITSRPAYKSRTACFFSNKPIRSCGLFLFIIMIFQTVAIQAQSKKLDYIIKRNGDEVGAIRFTQTITGSRTMMSMESNVKTRFLFNFTANTNEESVYDNGILTWSSVYRKMNGNLKADIKMQHTGSSYIIYNGEKTEQLNQRAINYNMLCVYADEPVSINKIYSDNFRQMLDIHTVAAHHYKIEMPDGSYNEYFYTNGQCTQIRIHHQLYSVTIELKS